MEVIWHYFEGGGVCYGNMNWIEGSDRHQTHLLPPTLEEYVNPDNPVASWMP